MLVVKETIYDQKRSLNIIQLNVVGLLNINKDNSETVNQMIDIALLWFRNEYLNWGLDVPYISSSFTVANNSTNKTYAENKKWYNGSFDTFSNGTEHLDLHACRPVKGLPIPLLKPANNAMLGVYKNQCDAEGNFYLVYRIIYNYKVSAFTNYNTTNIGETRFMVRYQNSINFLTRGYNSKHMNKTYEYYSLAEIAEILDRKDIGPLKRYSFLGK